MERESPIPHKPEITNGVHHVGLTVDNVSNCCAFFVDILGFKKVVEKPAYPAIFVSDGSVMLTLWQVASTATKVGFDRKNNLGLHHLALRVPDKEVLWRLYQTLRELPMVDIEFAPEKLGTLGEHMMAVVPGGIRLELVTVEGTADG